MINAPIANGDLPALNRAEAELCKRDLRYLCQEVLGYKDWDLCHDDLNQFLKENQDAPRELILIPREHLKTSIVTVGGAIQEILKNPNVTILISNLVLSNAEKILSEIKECLMKPDLVAMFGNFVGPLWNRDEIVVRQRTSTDKTPTISIGSPDKVLTSQHYDFIILDDILDDSVLGTADQILKTRNYYSKTIDLLKRPHGKLRVVGTRYDDKDLYGYLMREMKDEYKVFFRGATKDNTMEGELIFPKKFNHDILKKLLKEKGSFSFYCTPAETPILMADFSFKPISKIVVGDEVIGWQVQPSGRRFLVKSKVTACQSKIDMVAHLKMRSGRRVRCTRDHAWYTGRGILDKTHKEYAPAKVGSKLKFVLDPTSQDAQLSIPQKIQASWLGGIFDGEGSCSPGHSTIFLAQSRAHNSPVCDRIESVLNNLGFKWGRNESSHSYFINGGMEERVRFLKWCDPVRGYKIIANLLAQGGRFVKEDDEVLEITDDGYEPVYALTTETGNYVAWGYASKNCQYFNQPINRENQQFKPPVRYWTELPPVGRKIVTVDLAPGLVPGMQDNPEGDNNAITSTIFTPSNQLFVVKYRYGRFNVSQTIDYVFDYVNSENPWAVGIEANAYQRVFIHLLNLEMKKRNKSFQIFPIVQHRDKFTRLMGLQPLWESGDILLKQGMVELEEEFDRFPRGMHDDILDTLEMALHMVQGKRTAVEAPKPYASTDSVSQRTWELLEKSRARSKKIKNEMASVGR